MKSLGHLHFSHVMKSQNKNAPLSWCSSTFDAMPEFTHQRNDASKRNHFTHSKEAVKHSCAKNSIVLGNHLGSCDVLRTTQLSRDLLVDKYTPQHKCDLAVHLKKVSEVESWLIRYYASKFDKSPFLLLTGPSGSGKTATVRTLATDLHITLHEWQNSFTSFDVTSFSDDLKSRTWTSDDRTWLPSQTSQFRDFLLRCHKYEPLSFFSSIPATKKCIVIEEFPNVFLRNQKAFQEILRDFYPVAQCPVIFIVSDSSHGERLELQLFPKSLQTEMSFTNISFNPVSQTLLTKLLRRIIDSESIQISNDVIESLAALGSGDIRATLNSLQFYSLQGSVCGQKDGIHQKKTKIKKRKTIKNSVNNDKVNKSPFVLQTSLARDASLFLFRALGKILYCKRSDEDLTSQLPSHLKCHERRPLTFIPEEVVEKVGVTRTTFLSFLHENYLMFITDTSSAERGSEYLSDCDFISYPWQNRERLEDVGSMVAVRGLLHANHPPSSSRSWTPLLQSQCHSCQRKMRLNTQAAQDLFGRLSSSKKALLTDIVPYLPFFSVPFHDPGQIQFINEITKFQNPSYRLSSKKFGEKDLVVCENDGDDDQRDTHSSLSNSQSNFVSNSNQDAEADDVIIEDFSD